MPAPSYAYELLADEESARWGAANPLGTPVTISYSFAASEATTGTGYGNFSQFTAVEQAAARQALAYIGEFTNINFVETSQTGQLQFGNGNVGSGIGGRATYNYDGSGIFAATVFLQNTGSASLSGSDFAPGSITSNDIGGHGWGTLLHELGHALGLKHSFERNNANDPNSVLPTSVDDVVHTVMSYTSYQPSNVAIVTDTGNGGYSYTYSNLLPQTYSIYDIAALQYLYGTGNSANESRTYSFSPTSPAYQTIHTGGPNTTIDCSALTGPNTIDLTPGAMSDLSIAQTLRPDLNLPDRYDGSSALAIAFGCYVAKVIGGSGSDLIIGNSVANSINGGRGDDDMRGGGGNDTYYANSAADKITEAAAEGNSDIVASSVNYTLGAGVYVEKLTTTSLGATSALALTGNAFAQTITGNAGGNTLSDGGGAADTMQGLGGNDLYYVHNSRAVVQEGSTQGVLDWIATSVSYTVAVGVWIEKLTTTSFGATSAINLVGNAVSQTISGNAGANVLFGKAGDDTLAGGGGADAFVFDTAPNTTTNYDRITDFNVADDTIRLNNAIFLAVGANGALAAGAFYAGTSAHDASDRIIYNPATGNVGYDADGTGAIGAIRFATLDTGLALTNGDFLVI
jgi:Ca2+-binding RTX toxin-like protein